MKWSVEKSEKMNSKQTTICPGQKFVANEYIGICIHVNVYVCVYVYMISVCINMYMYNIV